MGNEAQERKMAWMTQDWTTGQLNALVKNIGEANARAIIAGKARFSIMVESVLELISTISLPAQPRFVARDHFKVDTSMDAKVKIWGFGSNFETNFLEKIEEPVGAMEFAFRKLTKDLLDQEIRSEIGEEKEETFLSQLWTLLEKQGQGEEGNLLVNGYANIFYIRDTEGALWAVRADWHAELGWLVNANSVTNPRRWYAGLRVVSRN